MKLSNQQIDALLAVMEENHKAKNRKANEKSREDAKKKVQERVRRYMDVYKSVPAELRAVMYSDRNLTSQKLTERLAKHTKSESFDESKMRNKILIASIDSATMDELKKKIKIEL
jgi:flagellar motor switch protein FliM